MHKRKIEIVSTGIAGLDAILAGGLHHGSLTMIRGASGTGKSVFSLMFAAQPTAARALDNLKKICGSLEPDLSYGIEVVDIVENPEHAEDAKILATPTVVRELPPPIRRVVGELLDRDQVLTGLDLFSASTTDGA